MEALVDLLSEEPRVHLVGVAPSGDRAIELAHTHEPQMVVIDMESSGASSTSITDEFRKHLPNTQLVALSSYDDRATVRRIFAHGFHRHICKVGGGELLKILLEEHVDLA